MSPAFDPGRLLDWRIAPVEREFTRKDTILYALGIGVGADPCDAGQLRFVTEEGLLALPSFPTALAYPALWYAAPGTGVDLAHVVHAELGFENSGPFPVEGRVRGETRVTAVVDKGPSVGALLATECLVRDLATGQVVSRIVSSSMARNLGGFSEDRVASAGPSTAPPARPADRSLEIATLPQAALIYRLSGDLNPLHADPRRAREAGFDRPILHGRCTFGIAAWALVRLYCPEAPARLARMHARFSQPVFPGDTLCVESWDEGDRILFRVRVPARGKGVLSHGVAAVRN